MRKNIAGQSIGGQMISKTDGSAVSTGNTTVYITGDNGVQTIGSVGSGLCTHEGNGFWTYNPTAAETITPTDRGADFHLSRRTSAAALEPTQGHVARRPTQIGAQRILDIRGREPDERLPERYGLDASRPGLVVSGARPRARARQLSIFIYARPLARGLARMRGSGD